MPVLNPTASSTARLFLDHVHREFGEYLPDVTENYREYVEFCGEQLFGRVGPLTDEQIEKFYAETKAEVEIELYNYAVREGYILTAEMVAAEVTNDNAGEIHTTDNRRNALAFVFDGAMVP